MRLNSISLVMSVASLLIFTLGCASSTATAGQTSFVLQEQLNRTWKQQTVRYKNVNLGGSLATSTRLIGPDGQSLPVQLSDIEYAPGSTTQINQAAVSFYVDELPALASQTYTLHFGGQADTAPTMSDLRLNATADTLEITTHQTGVRLLNGQKTYDPPSPAGEVPGPVLGLRLIDGTWTGGSRLYGDHLVQSYQSRIIHQGPVFSEVEIRYEYAPPVPKESPQNEQKDSQNDEQAQEKTEETKQDKNSAAVEVSGNVVTLRFRVMAGNRAIEVDSQRAILNNDNGWELYMGGEKGVAFTKLEAITGRWSTGFIKDWSIALKPSAEPVAFLTQWAGASWWKDAQMALRLLTAGESGQVQLAIRDTAGWYPAKPFEQMANFHTWKPGAMGRIWHGHMAGRLPIIPSEDGRVTLQVNNTTNRYWTISMDTDGQKQHDTYSGKDQTAYASLPRLDEVKEMVLDWQDATPLNPRLLLNEAQLKAAAEQNPRAWKVLTSVEPLSKTLDSFAVFDMMRQTNDVTARYDTLINSDQITPEQRKLFRAQAAYLLYRETDPNFWSIEHGYTTGNPNMTVSNTINTALLAVALRGHPLAEQWIESTVKKVDFWLGTVADKHGYWPESTHYARVSWANLLLWGVVATRAGIHDYLSDPRWRTMAEFYEKTLTPPNPLRLHIDPNDPTAKNANQPTRVNAVYGRGVRYDAWHFGGILAQAYKHVDPKLSAQFQWSWLQSGRGFQTSHSLSSLMELYNDPNLPASPPTWHSERFNNLGYLLRQNFATPEETYLLLITEQARNGDGEIWAANVGSISTWFAHGLPVTTSLPSLGISNPLESNRVLPATNGDPQKDQLGTSHYLTKTKHIGTAFMDHLDYTHVLFNINKTDDYGHMSKLAKDAPAYPVREIEGKAPIQWNRQILLVDGASEHKVDIAAQDKKPAVQYMLLRDTVRGDQPTQWHFWTLSEKLVPSEIAASTPLEELLKDKPGPKILPASLLKGNQFTALGQVGIDIDYFIASPTDTPRYTLRYGTGGGAYGIRKALPVYHDLMHLQLPGDGEYFVLLFPRKAKQPAPQYQTLGEGKVIHLTFDDGEHYAYLNHENSHVEIPDGPAFEGTAGLVRTQGQKNFTLTLAGQGSVSYRNWQLLGSTTASLDVGDHAARLETKGGKQVQLQTPPNIKLSVVDKKVKISQQDNGRYLLNLPEANYQLELTW